MRQSFDCYGFFCDSPAAMNTIIFLFFYFFILFFIYGIMNQIGSKRWNTLVTYIIQLQTEIYTNNKLMNIIFILILQYFDSNMKLSLLQKCIRREFWLWTSAWSNSILINLPVSVCSDGSSNFFIYLFKFFIWGCGEPLHEILNIILYYSIFFPVIASTNFSNRFYNFLTCFLFGLFFLMAATREWYTDTALWDHQQICHLFCWSGNYECPPPTKSPQSLLRGPLCDPLMIF